MSPPTDLTPAQKHFLAHACAFIATNPPRHELDKLCTLATLLLPVPVAEMLRKRIFKTGDPRADDQLNGWLQ
jgi:hypothetical protein